MKIAFIGGGSLSWTPTLVTDMALTPALAGANLVLHDIDADALTLLSNVSQRIVRELDGNLQITATTDRAATLRDADFVILCVAIGGLMAMRNDLAIPERYGVFQAVGDTVGPGGLARGLRNVPFAVQVAREMEQLCPHAWLLNVTNPMTTICRGVTKATAIRTIGLCHEVTGAQRMLAGLFGVTIDQVALQVAGINHLPALLQCRIAGRDGLAMVRDWVTEHGPQKFIDRQDSDPLRDIFRDRLAVKFTLFQQLGVLFGAGDRHVAEFFPGFLTAGNQYGARYGVRLTTITQREELAQQRRPRLEAFVAGAPMPAPLRKSEEQLTDVIAALSGGPTGTFIVNVPNTGQIDTLPRAAVVECIAHVGPLGVQPLAVGPLPHPAQAAIAPHVARQELIVEASLTGRHEAALAALTSDPLLLDPATAVPMLDELLAANAPFTH